MKGLWRVFGILTDPTAAWVRIEAEPGETVALQEVIGLGKAKIRRSPLTPWMTYLLAEDFL